MTSDSLKPKKRRRRIWITAGILFVLALLFSIWWMGPVPPRKIILATGEKEGTYAAIGREYQKQLNKMGLKVELSYTQGSAENLQLLLDEKADVALVQAGTYTAMKNADPGNSLRGLVAIQCEPVWFFCKKNSTVENLTELKGKTIAIGQKQSGTAMIANALLKANGVVQSNKLVHRSMQQTHDGLIGKEGDLDAAFLVSSANNPLIHDLVGREDIYLLNFKRQLAYTRLFPYLSPAVLGEGVIDLQKNLPEKDIKMFVIPTLLVCRQDFHPQAVEQFLMEARRIHSRPELISGPKQFPTLEGMDLPPHETARAYMHSGESILTRWLPYWGVLVMFRLQYLIVALISGLASFLSASPHGLCLPDKPAAAPSLFRLARN